MHDIRAIRENPQVYVAGWSSRGVDEADGLVADILRLDGELRHAQTTGQDALAKRNAASKMIGAAMGRKDTAEALAQVHAQERQASAARHELGRLLETGGRPAAAQTAPGTRAMGPGRTVRDEPAGRPEAHGLAAGAVLQAERKRNYQS